MVFKISSFYKFTKIENCQELKKRLINLGESFNLKGTILLAHEGINATIAGQAELVDRLLEFLKSDTRFSDLQTKEAFYKNFPFQKWKVKVKPEILTFGDPDVNPGERVGHYIKTKDWNGLIQSKEFYLIDTRNTYEISLGTFPGAINPQTKNFSDFKRFAQNELGPLREKKIAMFCTGGIRCEKASSYLLSLGYKDVYHLQGGVLKYLEEIDSKQSLWQGACFVFDERVSVTHGLLSGGHCLCQCGYPISAEDKKCALCKALTKKDLLPVTDSSMLI